MKANVYDEGRAPDMTQLNKFGKPMPQKAKAPARTGSAEWLVVAALLCTAESGRGGSAALRLDILQPFAGLLQSNIDTYPRHRSIPYILLVQNSCTLSTSLVDTCHHNTIWTRSG